MLVNIHGLQTHFINTTHQWFQGLFEKHYFNEPRVTMRQPSTSSQISTRFLKPPDNMWHQPIAVEIRPHRYQLSDPNPISNIIKRYFGIHIKPIDRPMDMKSCPKWVDILVRIPRGYKTPDFSTFSMENHKSTMKHIWRFNPQCG